MSSPKKGHLLPDMSCLILKIDQEILQKHCTEGNMLYFLAETIFGFVSQYFPISFWNGYSPVPPARYRRLDLKRFQTFRAEPNLALPRTTRPSREPHHGPIQVPDPYETV
jgi:hypothetical protein